MSIVRELFEGPQIIFILIGNFIPCIIFFIFIVSKNILFVKRKNT